MFARTKRTLARRSTHSLANYLEIYVVFGFFWAWNLTIAIGRTVMAGGVAAWYWSKDKKVRSCSIISTTPPALAEAPRAAANCAGHGARHPQPPTYSTTPPKPVSPR